MGLRERVRGFLGLRGNLLPISIMELLSNTGWNMFEVIWQPYVLSLGATVPLLGMLQGFEMALRAVLQLLWGRVSDAVGRRTPILASCVLALAGLVPFFAARSWIWMVPTLAFFALADSIWEPVFPTLVSESVEAEERGSAFGLVSLLWFLPGFFAPALGGFMAQRLGYRSIIGSMFVLEAASSLIFFLYVRETYAGSGKVGLGHLLSSLKGVLRLPSRNLSMFYVASTVYQFSWVVGEGILYAMLLKSFGLTLIQIGILANVFSISAALIQFPIGRLVDRHGGRLFMIVSSVVCAAVYAGYLLSGDFLGFVLCRVLRGFVVSAWMPAYNSYLANSVSAEERARSYGDLNCLKGLICFPAPILAAVLFDRVGFWAPITLGLALDLVVVGILVSMGGQSIDSSGTP